jgi:hypothetical protein
MFVGAAALAPACGPAQETDGGGEELTEISAELVRGVLLTADATVQDGAYAGTNDGRGSFLYANDVGIAGDARNVQSYLRFDLTGMRAVNQARLRLTGRLQSASPASVVVNVHATSSGWTETGITWSNRPALVQPALASRAVVYGGEQVFEWDLTAHVKRQIELGRTSLDLVVVASRSNLGRVRFASREKTNPPVLTVDETTPTPVPPPPPPPTPVPPPPPPPTPVPPPPVPSGGPTVAGCPMFPADNAWNRNIAADPVDPMSSNYIAAMNGGSRFLKADFGGAGEYGIPWIAVSGNQTRVPMQFDYDDESDPGPYPIPANAPIEGGPDSDGDRHIIVVDRDTCKLYETFYTWPAGAGWSASSGAIFDLRSNALRPDGWTSADAAGLPVLAGLVRRDEVQSGRIKHALRFTVQRTQRAYVLPATHYASVHTDPNLPPLGIRVRLKAGYDLSRFSPTMKVILTAMKEYGMFLADNGADWFVSGEANVGWNDDELRQLGSVPASAFEVIKTGAIRK